MKYKNRLLRLLLDFLQFGMFTFGGGWSIIAQMQKIYVEERHEVTNEEIIDLASIAKSLPGTMIGNVAMLFGYRMAGVPGGFICVIAMITPPMLILSCITFFYTIFQTNPWVIAAMTGIRSAIVPIIASAAYGMLKSAFTVPPAYIVAAVSFVLYFFYGVSCIWLVLMGMISGLLISSFYEKRGGQA